MSLDLKQKPLITTPAEQSGDVRAPSRRWRRTVALKGASFTMPFFAGFVVFTVVPVLMALSKSLLHVEKLRPRLRCEDRRVQRVRELRASAA